MKLSSHGLTPMRQAPAFGGCQELVSDKPPRPSSALPPVCSSHKASPKAISGRTSYLQVRLAFHPYPQLITTVCNRCVFGPPRAVTRASAWPWVAHLVSGLPPATALPSEDGNYALGRLAFATAVGVTPFTSRRTVTRRFVLQKARHHPSGEPPTGSGSV